MPFALSIGISYEQFWHLNPRKLKPFEKAYKLRQKQIDGQMWMMGRYVLEAFNVVMANSFGKKGTHVQYREKPFMAELDTETKEMSEAEKIEKTNSLFGMFRIMQTNFNNYHGVENG